MNKKVYLTNKQVLLLAGELMAKICIDTKRITMSERIYGVPRGGIPAAYAVKSRDFSIEIVDKPEDADVIVDDIIASGKTRDAYVKKYNKPFLALIDNPEPDTWYVFPWEETLESSATDIPTRMLEFIGEDVNRDGLKETPSRVVRSWEELYRGYNVDPKSIIKEFDNDEHFDQMILLDNIQFYSTCEHHLLPFFGKCHIAYIPSPAITGGKIIGISKLARIVDCFSRRLQVQERLTQQIANFIEENLHPLGVAVMVEAQHLCMIARGVQKQDATMTTTALTGILKSEPSARAEFYSLVKR